MIPAKHFEHAGRATLGAIGLYRDEHGALHLLPRRRGTRVGYCFRVRVCWAFLVLLGVLVLAAFVAALLLVRLYHPRECTGSVVVRPGEQAVCRTTRFDELVSISTDDTASMTAWYIAEDALEYLPERQAREDNGTALLNGTASTAEAMFYVLEGSTLAADVGANATVRMMFMDTEQYDSFWENPGGKESALEEVVGRATTNFTLEAHSDGQVVFVVANQRGCDSSCLTRTRWTVHELNVLVNTSGVAPQDTCNLTRSRTTCSFALNRSSGLFSPPAVIVVGNHQRSSNSSNSTGVGASPHVVRVMVSVSSTIAVVATLVVYVVLLLATVGVFACCCAWDAQSVQRRRDKLHNRRMLARKRVRFGKKSMRRVEPYDAHAPLLNDFVAAPINADRQYTYGAQSTTETSANSGSYSSSISRSTSSSSATTTTTSMFSTQTSSGDSAHQRV